MLNKDNIKLIQLEIVPLYDGYKYQLHYTYSDSTEIPIINNNGNNMIDYISIDLGINNLMTIYDPTGKQMIISGKYLTKLNNKYNKLIDHYKSVAKKRIIKIQQIE